MEASVSWERDRIFVGMAESGYPVRMSSPSGPEAGVGPVELTAMALAACTAMDVISILQKKQEDVSDFKVLVHAERTDVYPKVITSAELEYVVTGHNVTESSLLRAIELSVRQYCPVHAMLSRAFPIALSYTILEGDRGGNATVARKGRLELGASGPAKETG